MTMAKTLEKAEMRRRITATTDDIDIPPDVAESKAKLETKTGTKYKYRKDLPSVQHMLAHGAPEQTGRPQTWLEFIGYPLALAIIFLISLLIFHHAPHDLSKQPKRKFSLPKHRPPMQQENVLVQDKEDKDPVTESEN